MNPVTRIAVIGGTGAMGVGLAYRWAKAGYPVTIGSRTEQRAQETARQLQERVPEAAVSGAENSVAAAAADLVVLTVPYAHHQSTLAAVRASLSGKVLVDATVPLRPPKVGRESSDSRMIRLKGSLATGTTRTCSPVNGFSISSNTSPVSKSV